MTREQVSMPHGFRYWVDAASEASIEGWAVGTNGTCRVDVLVDGRLVGQATTGIPRPDVATALPEVNGSDHAGFAYTFKREDFDDSAAERAQVSIRLVSESRTEDSQPVTILRLRSADERAELPRSPFPPSITALLLRASQSFRTRADLSGQAICFEAIDA